MMKTTSNGRKQLCSFALGDSDRNVSTPHLARKIYFQFKLTSCNTNKPLSLGELCHNALYCFNICKKFLFLMGTFSGLEKCFVYFRKYLRLKRVWKALYSTHTFPSLYSSHVIPIVKGSRKKVSPIHSEK